MLTGLGCALIKRVIRGDWEDIGLLPATFDLETPAADSLRSFLCRSLCMRSRDFARFSSSH